MQLACCTIGPAADKLALSKPDGADQQQGQHGIRNTKQT